MFPCRILAKEKQPLEIGIFSTWPIFFSWHTGYVRNHCQVPE